MFYVVYCYIFFVYICGYKLIPTVTVGTCVGIKAINSIPNWQRNIGLFLYFSLICNGKFVL